MRSTGVFTDIPCLISITRSRATVLSGQHVRPLLALKPQQYVPLSCLELHTSKACVWRDLSLASVCSSTFGVVHDLAPGDCGSK